MDPASTDIYIKSQQFQHKEALQGNVLLHLPQIPENSDRIQQRNPMFISEVRPSWWLPHQDQRNS